MALDLRARVEALKRDAKEVVCCNPCYDRANERNETLDEVIAIIDQMVLEHRFDTGTAWASAA